MDACKYVQQQQFAYLFKLFIPFVLTDDKLNTLTHIIFNFSENET